MILTRAPLRISFAGGGSDLPAFLKYEQGAVFSAAIRLYMHIAYNNRPIETGVRLAYSQTENVATPDELTHDIAREILHGKENMEVHSISDVPGGTGLGSSSAYAVALTLAAYVAGGGTVAHPETLARYAGMVETVKLKKPIGRQDHYASAYGGLRRYVFDIVDGVTVGKPLDFFDLESRLILVYLGDTREQRALLTTQANAMQDARKRDIVSRMVNIAHSMYEEVIAGHLDNFGRLLHEEWELKQSIVPGMSTAKADALYASALRAGALGGKVCGAGGGGFLMLYAPLEKMECVKAALDGAGVQARHILPVEFDTEGAKVVYSD